MAAKLRQATSTVTDELKQLRASIEEKRREVSHVRDAAVPLDEIEARIRKDVADAGAEWLRQWGSSLVGGGDRSLGAPGLKGTPRLPWAWREALPWGALCAADPASAVAMMTALVRRIEYVPGPPLRDRPAIVARLEAELTSIERSEEQMVDECNEAGVTVAHRPEVTQRREQEHRTRELQERAVADRKARQDALDAGSRTGMSQYLAQQATKE